MSDIVCGGDAISVSNENETGSNMVINRHYIVCISQQCRSSNTIRFTVPDGNLYFKVRDCMNVYEQLRKFMHNI
jgi:hypothetical protein